MTRRRHMAIGALALCAAGCGSTVQNVGSTQLGAAGGQSLTAPAGTTGSGVPGAGSSGSSGFVGGNTIAGSGVNGAGGNAQYAGQSGSGAGAGGVSAAQPGDGPGVTATTINIAATYDPDAAAADSALGAANANPGDIKTEETAVINYINTHGGVAHRELNPIWYKASASQDANTTFQQMCSTWTSDNKVFVMAEGSPILDQCTADEHAIGLDVGSTVLETSQQNRKFPADINLTSFTIDHGMLVTINGLARQGYFSNGAKVGIATWDDPYYHSAISSAAQPALARLGLHNVPVQYIAVPQSYGDLGATSSAAGSAVLRFRTMGIDHVILFDGPAGVNSSGVLVLEWTQQANSQQYYPKYGLNSTSAFNTAVSDYPQKELNGSVGVSWIPPLDGTAADEAPRLKTPAAQLCLKIMKDAGQQQASGTQAQAIQLVLCDGLFFLKQVLDPISGPLNQQTALAAINALRTGFTSMVTFGVDLTSNRHDGAYLVRNMAYSQSCSCFNYTSQPYDPY